MFFKSIIATTVFTAAMSVPAMAGNGPAKKLSKLDYRLDQLERRGVIKQGSRLDRLEDRIDRREDRLDRRTNNGPKDRIEDRLDRRENRWDRRR